LLFASAVVIGRVATILITIQGTLSCTTNVTAS
jgi:hypothetical protein